MSAHAKRWTAVSGWTTLMLIVWALFVPRGLSVGTFTLLAATGALLLLSASLWWPGHRRSPAIARTRP